MKTFAIGDIHGGYKALKQCLNASRFHYEEDQLIVLGDVCDGWPQTRECIDELLQIKNLIFILGNHDWWALQWFKEDEERPEEWITQGGQQTIDSYRNHDIPRSHIALLEDRAKNYYVDQKNRLFVHGGINPYVHIMAQSQQLLLWDRELIWKAYNTKKGKLTAFDEVFVGHTTTSTFKKCGQPVNYCEIWDLDSGGGWEGKLTVMNVDTHEYWQSDWVYKLYPGTEHALRLTQRGPEERK